MWTNIFKIGGLHWISWFQFLPNEFDFSALPDKSVKVDPKDAAMSAVLSAHLQLQKEGFLSAWTNSFVGPWDPSQGLHNPDEKIKLWLFLPGQHSSINEKAQHAVATLRVLASGFWVSPGDSEEVASAISQALRNCIERALRGFSYVRFGDVFSKYQPFTQNEELFRRGQPVAEFIFAATEETIFVHVIISAKHVRALSNGDIEPFLSSSSRRTNDQIPVVVSPHGMHGKLTGCCPGDLVKQVFLSSGKFRDPNGTSGLPFKVARGSGLPTQQRGQNCFVEVSIGCQEKLARDNVILHSNFSQPHGTESPASRLCNQRWPLDKLPISEKKFVYPTEAVLVPVMQTSFARSSLKRFWLQNWAGPSLSASSLVMHCFDFGSDDKVDSMDGSSLEPSGTRSYHGYRSSSNSNSSSYGSMSSSSSDSDRKVLGARDLEADADSLMSRQSGLSSLGQMQNDVLQLGSKRPRSGTSESFGQAGMVLNPSMTDYGTMEANMSINGATNENVGSQWGWDDDDRGMGMDIQALLSEFGDFGDFFENDALPLGEPPGTAESQVLMFPAPDGGELCSSPSTSVMDVPDRMLVSTSFPTFDNFNQLNAPDSVEDSVIKNQETTKSSAPSQVTCMLPSSNIEFDHVVKAEALMSFAPEYGGVEAPNSEISSVIFRSPYIPRSCKVDSASSSSHYVYSATPPSPCCNGSHEKSTLPSEKACAEKKELCSAIKSKKYYTHVERGKQQTGASHNSLGKGEVGGSSAQFFALSQADVKPVSAKASDSSQKGDNCLPSARTVLATEIECLVCQVSMCRLRHTLLSSSNISASSLSGLSCSTQNLGHNDSSTMVDNMSCKSELKKKETIPVRIAGDVDGGMLDGSLTAPVGVWRSVGIPKVSKPSSSNMEVCPSIPHNSFMEESMLSYGLRQPLQELLDGIAFLVQQATSLVDVALDADCGDGPYGWLALQEQRRRGFSCGPSMVHAGCGGLLASSHSLDIAGMELVDPLSVDVQASLTIGLLQSDIKEALKSAFSNADGPLSVMDWCRGRNPSNESAMTYDGHSAESIASASECRDSSSTVTLSVGDPMSPSLTSAGGASGLKGDGTRGDDGGTSLMESDQQHCSRIRPTLSVVPFPSILVGYQDDWLKTSAGSLQLWEKAPLEPYATVKHMSYYVVCPNIDPLTTAATDFFLQLGTVYETCKLGTHAPQSLGNEMDIDSKKISPGFALLDCPQSMKIDTYNASMLGSISDYFLFLSNGWDLTSYLKTLSKVLKTLKFGSPAPVNSKEGNGGPCTVVYVVCPFPEPLAVLQTVVEASIAIGSVIRSSDKERRSMMHNQVAKALSYPASVDESFSNVLTLTGFSIPKLVLQIVTVDAIFRVTSPKLNELIILKEIAFTVYNKARRISRGASGEAMSSLSVPGGSHSVLMQMSPSVPGMWKDCVGSRIGGPPLQRENELDTSLRQGAWDNSWQTARSGGLGADPSRTGDIFPLDDIRCLFEPLFILAEPGSIERGLSPFFGNSADSSKLSDDCTSTSFVQNSTSSGTGDNGPVSQHDSLDSDGLTSGHQKSIPSLHCCYGWTEDWRWMVCIWTDSRGELLDSCVYPFGGISSRQDTKGLQSLFVQILQQGCQILQACSPDAGVAKPRDLVITRIGCFFELECQEWQKALYAAGGSEVKKWSLQLRRSLPDGMPAGNNGNSLQQQEMGLMQERALPSSPSTLYGPHSKSSSFMKGGIAQPSSRKQLMGGHAVLDNSKGLLQWVQSVSFVSVSIDHSLQLVLQADSSPGSSQGSATSGLSGYLEGYTPVKSLGSTSASYLLVPSPSMRFLPPSVLQLPTCLTADSPPLAHLLHSKGSAIPLSTGFVVSKAVPSMRRDARSLSKEEWPSVLSVSLIDYCGGNVVSQEKSGKGANKPVGRGVSSESKDIEVETHIILDTIAAELHALSWMTASPAYLERRSALPFHCDMVLRLRRLLHFADKERSRLPEKAPT
ncbi:mediator of RNA polymerase II transcription subunit 13-like isoform X1 [Salvia splendens]|uniref:mediator of RNA polymerase II transcription subunit 13-like isoform X1 n=1 Tax=Salvia splendens TaxID=180675 RepID=UPI001C2570FB|nr:mediator of RNA polymerase II transcription subunit 13-like isoform X1 [Salvia splendens]XP_042003065.1 mediator of RNA polymerase II transcription subunit 13-like isoform X1 [Salvia splendens]